MSATLALVTLSVEDWYEAVDFYHDILGLELVACDEVAGRARLRAAPGVLLEIHSGGWGSEFPKGPKQNPVTICLRVERLDTLAAELEHRGVYLLGEPERGALLLADPEGNRLCLFESEQSPTVPDGWELERMLADDAG